MFKKMFSVLACLLLVITGYVFASVGVQEDSGAITAATDLNFTGAVQTSGTSTQTIDIESEMVEEADTPDSVTQAEGGTTFIATSSEQGGKEFDLPAITSANDGLTYTFMMGEPTTDTASGGADIDLVIQPASGDVIFLNGHGTAGAPIRADTKNASDSYPTIELRAFGGDWFVVNMTGTWTAG